MKAELPQWQKYCFGLALLGAGIWFLYKPVVSIFHLVETGQLPTMMIRRPFPGRWFEAVVDPLSFEGCKSWLAYSFLALPGAGLLAVAWHFFFEKSRIPYLIEAFQIWFYVSCFALFLLIAYDFMR